MNPITRRHFIGLAAATVGAVSLEACGLSTSVSSTGKRASTVRANFFIEPAPYDIAKSEGWFEKATGAAFQWKQVQGGAEVITLMASGDTDVGMGVGMNPVILGISKGVPFEIVSLLDDTTGTDDLVVRPNISQPIDLVGKKVAVPFGSSPHLMLLEWMSLKGLSQSQVHLLDLGGDQIYAAWQRGDLDATMIWEPIQTQVAELGGKVMSVHQDLAAAHFHLVDSIIVRKQFAQDYPDTVTDIVRAAGYATDFWNTQHQLSVAQLAKFTGASEADTEAAMKGYDVLTLKTQATPQWLGTTDNPGNFADALKEVADIKVQLKSLDSAPTVAVFRAAMNPDFVNAALARPFTP
jgi:taurine transport system substrate-binding protein